MNSGCKVIIMVLDSGCGRVGILRILWNHGEIWPMIAVALWFWLHKKLLCRCPQIVIMDIYLKI